jgi:hypothetical protein
MGTDWVTGADGDPGAAERDGVMWGIYLGDPGVDSLHRILYLVSSHTMNDTLNNSRLLIAIALSQTPYESAQFRGSSLRGSFIPSHPQPLPTLLEPEPLFLTNAFWNAVRAAVER